MITQHRRYNTPPPELPVGTMSLTRFAWLSGIDTARLTNQVKRGLLEVTEHQVRSRVRRYFTPDQQRAAYAFWDRHGITYRKPAAARESEAAQ